MSLEGGASHLDDRLRELRESLTALSGSLEGGAMPRAELEDFKGTLDDVRASLIGIVSATHAGDYHGSMMRFHAGRAVQLTHALVADVIDGTVSPMMEGFRECYTVVEELRRRLATLDLGSG